MIWDTGAHSTIVSDDMLSDAFRQYLTLPVHEPYRSDTGVNVQIDLEIRFSNTVVHINSVCLVVPTSAISKPTSGHFARSAGCYRPNHLHQRAKSQPCCPGLVASAQRMGWPCVGRVRWPIWWNPSILTGICPGSAFVCTIRPRRSHRSSKFFINFSLENIQGLYAEIRPSRL